MAWQGPSPLTAIVDSDKRGNVSAELPETPASIRLDPPTHVTTRSREVHHHNSSACIVKALDPTTLVMRRDHRVPHPSSPRGDSHLGLGPGAKEMASRDVVCNGGSKERRAASCTSMTRFARPKRVAQRWRLARLPASLAVIVRV